MFHGKKIAVVLPAFNEEKQIGEVIGAIPDFVDQIIVVDDGSTDNTREVIQPYLDRVRYFETENGGPAHARNIAMRAATGEYLAFLDSDDVWRSYAFDVNEPKGFAIAGSDKAWRPSGSSERSVA